MSNFKSFFVTTLLVLGIFSLTNVNGQCYTPPTYCTNISASNVGGFGMGIQNVVMGSISNATASGNGSPIYFNYTNLSTVVTPGTNQSFTITVGNSNLTTFKIYVDWNQDGTFNTTAPEMCYTSATISANGVVSSTIAIPAGQATGVYRLRIASDFTSAPGPCGPLVYSAEIEDYSLLVAGASPDASVNSIVAPSTLVVSPTVNPASFTIRNLTNVNMTSVSAGYSINGGTPTTQTFTGLAIAPGGSYTVTFSTGFTVPSLGSYAIKYWLYDVNASGTQITPANDTICQTLPLLCTGPLSGAYTIDATGGVTPTNFQSFTNAAMALKACGVSGPVTFNVAANTYVDTLYIPSITGASATNTITFDGGNGNKASRILTFPTSGIANDVVRFNGCSYVTIRNMTIRSTGSSQGWVVHFMNDFNDKVGNCNIEFTGAATTSSSSTFMAVIINNSLTNYNTQSNVCRNIFVDSNVINYGYIGIASSVNNGTYTNYFRNNSILNSYQGGIYINGSQIYKINNNIINMLPTGSIGGYGINNINANATAPGIIEITGNKIFNAGQYGIFSQTASGGPSNMALIYNNFIGGGFRSSPCFGINSTSSYYKIYHNSVNMNFNSNSGTSAALYMSGGFGSDVRNNNFVVTATAALSMTPVNITNTSFVSNLNNNNYFNASAPNNLLIIGSTTYTNANYTNAYPSGGGAGSFNNNPNYTTSTDLHTTVVCNNGANLTADVPTDIDGDARPTTPDLGADEIITVPNNDIQVSSITTPNFPLATGTQTVTVVVKNVGANTVNSFDVNYRLNNGTVVTEAYAGAPIAPCGTAIFTFATNVTISSGSSNFKVYTTSPNGVSDAIPANDTAQWTMCPAMSGTYTINPLGSGSTNFTSFTSAIAALNCGGVNGPVVFNVSNGTYNEQLFLSAVNGASATNTIKFQSLSGIAANCIINFTTLNSQAIIDLNGADYFIFDKFTIRNLYTSTDFGVWLRNGADFNTISNCIIDVNASSNNGYGVYQNNTTDNKNNIIGNTINGGYCGVYLQSNSSTYSNRNIVNNNIVNGAFVYGILIQYTDSLNIIGNTITSNSSSSSFYGIYTFWSQKGPVIAKNKIAFTSSYTGSGNFYGIQMTYFNINTFNPTRGLCANNMIQVGGNFATAYGIQVNTSTNYTDFLHNTVNMNTPVANGSYALYVSNGMNNDTIRNNIFQCSGSPSGYAAYVFSGTNMCYDRNNFYTRNSNFALYNGGTYASYAAWKSAAGAGIPGFESGGVSKEATFISSTDLHTTTPCIADLGYNYTNTSPSIARVLDDFDGQSRSTTPDLGCDEFTTAPFDAATQLMTSPTGSVFALATPYTIKTVIRNNGSSTINSIDMNYSVNGGAATTQTFTGLTLLPCDTITLTFTTPLTLTSSGSNALRIFNGLINSSNADGNNVNDTLITNLCTPYSGTYTIDKTAPFSSTNFTSVNQAINSMYSCGMSGPVVLRIVAGSGPYNEQVTFNGLIPGISRINNLRLSGNTTRETITFNPTSATAQHTIRLITAKHITLDSLTINNTGASFGVGVHLVSTSDSNYVTNSNINISTSNTSISNSAGIAISTNTSNVTTNGNNGNKNVFDNNTITGGFFGISATGTNSTVLCRRNEVTNNRLYGQAYYGIYWYFQDTTKINGNTIDNMLSSNINSYGILIQNIERFEIKKNRINRVGQYGMFLQNMNYQSGSGTARSEISNNMIGGMFYNSNPSGIYIPGQFRNIDFWHNTVHVLNLNNGYAIFFQYTSAGTHSGLDFRNNSFTATGNSSNVSYLYFTPNNPFTVFSNNNIYGSNTVATQALFSCSGFSTNTWFGTVGSCVTINNVNCKWAPPQFNNDATNLHTLGTNLSNAGVNIGAVTSDIDGDARPLAPSSTVDIGADEYNIPNENIGAVSVITPVAPITLGTQDVIVQIKNFGLATITSANVRYKVGVNGAIKTVAWTGSIASNATANVTFTGANQYNFTGVFDTVIAWTDGPNGLTDAFVGNDTFVNNVVCQPLAGVYTLDPGLPASSTNFINFTSMASRLNNCGVTGPVTVNVAAGTYTEQFELKQYPGVSATNTVTIQSASGIASSVVLQYNTATIATNNYVVYMNGTDYTKFQNMTMTNTNTGIGSYVIWQLNNSRFNTFQNIIFNGASTTSTSTQYAIIYANNTSSGIPGQGDDNNTFNQCAFNNGSYGFYYYSSYGSAYSYNTTITNNTFTNQASQGIQLQYHFNCNISRNTFTTNTTNYYYGIYFYGAGISNSGTATISKNNIIGNNQGVGIYLQYFIGNNAFVTNNMVKIGNGSTTAYGIQTSYSMCKIYHNTFNITSSSTTNPAVYLQYGCCYSPFVDFKFNIVANSGNGTTSGMCIWSDVNNASNMKIDSNVYYQGPGAVNFGTLNGTTFYSTFAAWKSGMGVAYDPASVVANPNFFSPTNLHINLGTNLKTLPISPLVVDDIDNLNRCGFTDAGADHHPAGLDAGISAITIPAGGVASPGLQDIKVVIRNYGLTTLTSANVSYNINGTVQTKAWTGSLATCATDTVVFSGAQQYNFTGPFTMKAFSDNPNGISDPNVSNDTSYSSGCVGMGGIYTIGGTPGPTNFATFGAAITAMTGCGIGSPIVFQVAAGTYTEQVTVPNISGASAINTITFDGGNGNKATRILAFAPTSTPNAHVVRFDGCNYVNFRNLTIRSTSSSGTTWVVHFFNGTNNRINNCTVEAPSYPIGSGSFFNVVINGDKTTNTNATSVGNNHTVDSSLLNNSYYNILTSASNGGNNTFRILNNTLNNGFQNALYSLNPHVIKFNNNIVNLSTSNTSNYCIYLQSLNLSGSFFNEFNYNKFNNPGQFGIYLNSCNGSNTTPSQFIGNFMNGFRYVNGASGIYCQSTSYWNIYHNTINLDVISTSGTSACYYLNNGSFNDIRNNILTVMKPTALGSYPMWISPTTAASNVNNNIYYNKSSTNLMQIGGINYNVSTYLNTYPSGGGINSYNVDPGYVSASDIHITSPCNNGTNLGITSDIDGDARSSTPDIGADEVVGVTNNDIQVLSITTPNFPLSTGAQTVSVVIKNVGGNNVSSFNINYRLNNGTVVTEAYSGAPISPCATSTFTFATPVTIVSGTNNLKTYTSQPNGVSDAVPNNDTAQWTMCPAMSGTYTINPLGSGPTNFTSFTSAIAALNCGGISSSVTFNVSNGTYAEQLFLSAVNGASATKTIKFQSVSGIAANCIISFVTPNSQAIIDLNGADYFTFDKFTIRNLYTGYGFGVWLRNGSDFNTISNCIIDMNASGTNGYGIYQSNTTDNNNTFIGNTINGGNTGVMLQSNTSTFSNRNAVINNTINNSFNYGIYYYYTDSMYVVGNTIISNSANSNFYGIYSFWSQKGPVIAKNKIVYTSSYPSFGNFYGIQANFFNMNSSNPTRGLCANNMIQVGGTFSTAYGIQMINSCNYSDIIHNSVNMTNTQASGSYALHMGNGFSYDTIRNNIFQSSGSISGYAALINSGTNMCYDRNNFYTRNANFAVYNSLVYANYASWKAASVVGIPGFEAGGVSKEVSFVSPSDLHTTTPCIADLGFNYTNTSPAIARVLDDIDGQSRSTTPDIGCDEYSTAPYDVAMQLMTSPSGSVFALATPYTIKVVVKNNGSSTINNLDMNYTINGGSATSQTFTGLTLLPCDTTTLTFTVPLTLTTSGSNVLRIFNGLINTTNADGNNTNDTLLFNLCTPYSGTYTINQGAPFTPTNFTSVAQAVNSMTSCGISGPVVLRIVAGSGPYNEQVTFSGLIPGISATNNVRLTGNTTREVITFNPSSASAQHTIRLISSKHITLDSLTINNTGSSFGVGVHLVSTSDSNYVTNSVINISLANISFPNSAGIAISTNTSNVTSIGNNGNKNIFNNNTINGGCFGISAYGTSTAVLCNYNEVTNNRLNGQAFYGINWLYQDLSKINGNTIDNMLSTNSSSVGLNALNIERFEIKKNRINRVGQYGMLLQNVNYQSGTGSSRAEISNNMVGGIFYNTSSPNGVYVTGQFRNVDFWHNTINVVNLSNGYSFFMQYSSFGTHSGLDFRNNSFTATGNSSFVGYFYFTPNNPFTVFSNNNIYGANTASSQAVFGCGGFNTNTWMGSGSVCAPYNNVNCKWVPPLYNNDATDLHTLSANLSNVGVNIGAVTTDIDGDTRPLSPSSTVDIGADEYNVPAENIGAVAVITPTAPITTGTQDVVVQIKNFGASTITSANVRYKVGINGSVQTVAWTGSIATGATANVTFTGANQYNFTGSFDTVIAWTDGPNGLPDGYVLNDTFVNNVVCQPLAGVYTLDPGLPASATNFINFSSMAARLNNCGLTGPVTVNVAAGTYTEQFELKQFPGVSSTNTVTIQSASGIASSVVLQFNTATIAANNYVVYMNGTDYTKFQNMTLTNTNTGIGSYVIWQLNNSRFNTFQNIIFNGAPTTSTSTQYSIVFANNSTPGIPGQGDDNNTFNQCTFNNGSNGIYYNSSYGSNYSFNTVITNNTFTNQSNHGIHTEFHFNCNISNNTLTTNSNNFYYGIYFYGGGVSNSGTAYISKNNINGNVQGYGIYAQYFIGNNAFITNNMIKIGAFSNTAYGIYTSYSMCKIHFNTINVTSGATNNPAVYLQYGCCYSPFVDFKYNIVANSGNGSNSGLCIYSDVNNTSNMKIDSNVYFQGTGAVNFGSLNGINYATFAAWKAAMGPTYDPNSLVTNPNFVSSTNLHINSGTNLKTVPAASYVPDDIDGTLRCGLTDVGADHHPANNDISASLILYPFGGVAAPGLQDVKIVIRNLGTNTITSANVSYNINGTIQTKAWTGSLATCATDTIVFTGAQQYNFTGGFTMKAYTDGPNGNTDVNVANDTLYSGGCLGMAGNYTIDPAGSGPSNYTTFAAAIAAMQVCGISGPVNFQVAAATYREKVTIPLITGSNSTNTVTFDGGVGNAPTRIIQSTTSVASPSILMFNTTSNVIVKNLTINTSSATDHYNVNFFNSTNCRLVRCILSDSANVSDPASNSNSYRIVVGGAANTLSPSAICNNIYIDSNITNMGYYSIYTSLNNGSNTIYVTNNILARGSAGVIIFNGNHTVKLKGNVFRPKLYGSYWNPQQGVFFNNVNPSSPNFHEVMNNITDSSYGYAYNINGSSGSISSYNVFANNMVYGSRYNSGSGINNNSSSYWKIYHNSVSLDNTNPVTGYCYNQNGGINGSVDVRNNNFAVTNSIQTGSMPVFVTNANIFSNFDYNNLYNAVIAGDLLRIGATNYGNFAAYPSGVGVNSKNIDPQYFAYNNLHIANGKKCDLSGVGGLGITTDIDNQTRSLTSPTMGADEVTANLNDLSITSILLPTTSSVSAGPINIKLLIKNVGSNVVNTGDVTYVVNGGAPVTTSLPSAINPCDTMSITLTGVVMNSGTNSFVAFTSQPNGTTDSYFNNDTIKNTYCTPLNGVYTVGGATPNYATFNAAVAALNCGGISGKVVFNVRPGVYNEIVQINSIIGSNDTNTVTFQSENGVPSSVILQNNTGTAFTLKLNQTDNIIIQNMKISCSTNPTTAIQVIASGDSCKNVKIYNNLINSTWAAFTTNNSCIYVFGHCPNLLVRKNTFSNASYGVYVSGQSIVGAYTSNVVIDSNVCSNLPTNVFIGISMNYCNAPVIRNNDVQKAGCCADQGIVLSNISNGGMVAYNKVSSLSGFNSGFNIQNINTNGETTPLMIYNNFISGTSNVTYGMYVINSNYVNIFNNSFNIASASGSLNNLYVNNSSGTNNNVKIVNNSFKSPSGIVSMNIVGTTLATAKSMIAECNYNNYYQGSGSISENVLNLQGTLYTIATAKGAISASPMNDSNSITVDPKYKSGSDLHIDATSGMDGKGKLLNAFFTNDIDGVARLTNSFDIGADDTAVLRTIAGDYVKSSGCLNVSGTNWIDVTDTFGKLVFSINPEGNNLGPTCWAVRIASPLDSIRKDSVMNTADGFKYRTFFLGRNLYITPTNQPASGKVSLRVYATNIEVQRLLDTAKQALGYAVTSNYMKMHKFHAASGVDVLAPQANAVGTDSSTFLAYTKIASFGSDQYFQFRTPGFSQFNPMIPIGPNPFYLPVTWLSFDAKADGRDAKLNWSTASEKNNDHFEVERSTDGSSFTTIAKVKGAGNSQVVMDYASVDKDAASVASVLYYRIKQVDIDGKFEYTKTKAVSFDKTNKIVVNQVYPNPFSNVINVNYTSITKDAVEVSVSDLKGQVVYTSQLQSKMGENEYQLNMPYLQGGMYIVKVSIAGETYQYKMVKGE